MSESIRLRPLEKDGMLSGFNLLGRYPQTTSEWMMTLVSILHRVATSSTLPHSTLFAVNEQHEMQEQVVADISELATLGADLQTCRRALLNASGSPLALLVLHPAGATPEPDLEEPGAHPHATGALLLPGLPTLGLDHRAAWAAVDTTGSVQRMQFTTHAHLNETLDLAVLATLIQD